VAKWFNWLIATSSVVAACAPPPEKKASAPAAPNPVLQGQRRAVNVTRLYDETCSKCHGVNGEGNGSSTQTLITREKYDQSQDRPFFDAIKNGVPQMGMDPYGETMSEPEIWALVVHIRELQSRGLRQKFGSPKPDANGVFPNKYHPYRIETFVDEHQGLRTPWGIDWLPDGRMLVTNLPGTMVVVAKDGKVGPEVQGLPASRQLGQGGLMEVAVHPDYAKNGWIYLAFTDPSKTDPRAGLTKVVRGKIRFQGDQATWTDQQTIFESPQEYYNGSGIHFGCRIVFDGKGHLFFSHGERGSGELAQDLTRPNGKIHRLNDDGTIPADNPFASAADKEQKRLGSIWSYGHRNPQGLIFGLDGTLWDTEHAPRGGDEVNRIERAANYGWPIITFGINYNDSPLAVPWPKPDQKFNMPIFRWLPSTGACGLDVVKGAAFPKWRGDLVAGGLSGQNVDRLRIENGKLVEHEELIQGMGRVREVATAPDGTIYVALNQPDKIIRLVPAK
jgi:glucose/arabinose dehydrogenase/mono/diheme cytochrome c family protein